MTVVNPKSISGINSITMASGSDNLLTIHSNNTTERVRVNNSGDVIVGSGVTLSADGHSFHTGVVTATSFSGDGSALTGIAATDNVRTGILDVAGVGTFRGDVNIPDKIIHLGDTNTAIRFPAADTITAETSGSERLRIDSSGRLLIGSTDGATYADSSNDDLIVGSSANGKNDGITILSGTSQNGSLAFADSGGAYQGLVGYVHNGDYLRLHAGNTLKVRIDTDGLKFNSDTASANALDDYEEGTYSVTITGSSSGSATLSNNYGVYTKIGRMVTVNMNVALTSKNGISGDIQISLPFTVGDTLSSTSLEANGVMAYFINLASNSSFLGLSPISGGTICQVRGVKAQYATSAATFTDGDFNNNTEFRGTVTYFV